MDFQSQSNPLLPLLVGDTLLKGNFWWVCASLVPLGGFRSMGCSEGLVFVNWLGMRQHMAAAATRPRIVDAPSSDPQGRPPGLLFGRIPTVTRGKGSPGASV